MRKRESVYQDFRGDFLFDFDKIFQPSGENKGKAYYPQANIYMDEENSYIDIVVAGLRRKEISVEVKENILYVSYQAGDEEEKKYKAKEFSSFRSFERTWHLGGTDDKDNVSATMKNGILTVVVPKIIPPKPKPKFIKIG